MKHETKVLFGIILLMVLVPFGSAAEVREAPPPLTVEMLAAALDVSYRCYDLAPVAGSEKSLYLEVVTKDGVILSRLITMLKNMKPTPKYLGLLMRYEGDKLRFSCLFLSDKSGVVNATVGLKIDNYMKDMFTGGPTNLGVYKLGEFFLLGASAKEGKSIVFGDRMDKLGGDIGFRIVAK